MCLPFEKLNIFYLFFSYFVIYIQSSNVITNDPIFYYVSCEMRRQNGIRTIYSTYVEANDHPATLEQISVLHKKVKKVIFTTMDLLLDFSV